MTEIEPHLVDYAQRPPARAQSQRGKGFLAVTASMFLLGAGQFLVGRRRRGLLWFGAMVVVFFLTMLALLYSSMVPLLLVLFPLGLLIQLAGWIDAYRVGHRSSRPLFGRPVVRYAIGLTLLLITLLVHPSMLVGYYVRDEHVEGFLVPTEAMSPTIEAGDRFLAHKRLEPRRWDVIAFYAPGTGGEKYVKRLVGLPGEQIELRQGEVYVNGQIMPRPAGIAPYDSTPSPLIISPRTGCEGNPIQLGDDEHYVLGDNSRISGDSRHWSNAEPGRQVGTISRASIIGVATRTYWPPKRWRRLRR